MAASPTIVEPTLPCAPPPTPRRRWRTWALYLATLSVLAVVAWKPADVFLGGNQHTVIPGKIYRGAQPNADAIQALVEQYGIRTIVNLRGTCYPEGWYVAEARAAEACGLSLADVSFSAGRMPSYHEIRQLVDVLDHAEPPLFLHCRQGADRTGVASVIALLLSTDTPYAQARRQLSLRYAHAPIGRPTVLDGFFDLYEEWLLRTGRTHDQAAIRRWLLQEYRGGICQSVIEDAAPLHAAARVGQPLSWRVRVRNTSAQSWHFKPTRTAGIHLNFTVWDSHGKNAAGGRAGFLEKTVAPGESLAVTVVVPPLATPGRYHMLIDLTEEGHCNFFQTGSEPYEEVFDVRD